VLKAKGWGRTAKQIGKDDIIQQPSGLVSKLLQLHCCSSWDSRVKADLALVSPRNGLKEEAAQAASTLTALLKTNSFLTTGCPSDYLAFL